MKKPFLVLSLLAFSAGLAVAGCGDDGGDEKDPSKGGFGGSGGTAGDGGTGGSGDGGTGGDGAGGDGGMGGDGGEPQVDLVGFLVASADTSNVTNVLSFFSDLSGASWISRGYDVDAPIEIKRIADIAFFPGEVPWPRSGRLLIADKGAGDDGKIVQLEGNPFGDPRVRTFPHAGTSTFQKPKNPSGVAYDKDGLIYIVDTGNHRVIRMNDITGSGYRTLGQRGVNEHQYENPSGIAIDQRDGWIYVADTTNNRVAVSTSMDGGLFYSLNLNETPQKLTGPQNVFVDALKRAYVVDTSNGRLVRFIGVNPPTAAVFGEVGSGEGQFKGPNDVWVDGEGDQILVVDRGNNRIVKMDDMEGNGWQTFGTAGVGPGQFRGPVTITRTR